MRLRHTLSEQRGEWQQRIQATLYHHGCPQRRQLMTGDERDAARRAVAAAAARETVTIALAMIDALDRQMLPLEKELRAYARRQAGCKALMVHYGIGELCAVTILSELGDCTRFPPHARRSGMPGWTSPCTSQISAARPGTCRRQGPPALRWALFEAAQQTRRRTREETR